MTKATSKRVRAIQIAPSVLVEDEREPGDDARNEFIATAAYYKAEARGFAPGAEIDDWLDAEAEFEEGQRR